MPRSRPRKLFFDLDGTLVDSKPRIHRLFCELAGTTRLTFDDYWRLKRDGVRQRNLLTEQLGFSEAQVKAFKERWLEQIEDEDRLQEDRPLPQAAALLRALAGPNDMYVVTGRQSRDKAHSQIESFGWGPDFKRVLATGLKRTKDALILAHYQTDARDVIIGDSGEDIQAGHALGIRTLAVSWGYSRPDRLESYKPERVIAEIDDLPGALDAG